MLHTLIGKNKVSIYLIPFVFTMFIWWLCLCKNNSLLEIQVIGKDRNQKLQIISSKKINTLNVSQTPNLRWPRISKPQSRYRVCNTWDVSLKFCLFCFLVSIVAEGGACCFPASLALFFTSNLIFSSLLVSSTVNFHVRFFLEHSSVNAMVLCMRHVCFAHCQPILVFFCGMPAQSARCFLLPSCAIREGLPRFCFLWYYAEAFLPGSFCVFVENQCVFPFRMPSGCFSIEYYLLLIKA